MKNILLCLLLSMTLTQANDYQHLSTSELEQAVEKLSINGTLPFEMGLELIKRWTNS